MKKFTIVRRVLKEEIYEVVAETSLEALNLAKQGEGLNESISVDPGSDVWILKSYEKIRI